MSTHPNSIIMVVFTPDDLSRKTYRHIVANYKYSDSEINDGDVRISGLVEDDQKHYDNARFNSFIVEDADEVNSVQIEAPEGSIVFYKYLTYGFCEKIEWDDVRHTHEVLEAWATEVDKEFKCSHKIYISANYW